jgi:hypothetical protein
MTAARWLVAPLALAVLIALAGTSTAQPPRGGAGGPPSFDRLLQAFDDNGDGKLSQDEVPAGVWRRLGRADGNGDGVVTKSEYDTARGG